MCRLAFLLPTPSYPRQLITSAFPIISGRVREAGGNNLRGPTTTLQYGACGRHLDDVIAGLDGVTVKRYCISSVALAS